MLLSIDQISESPQNARHVRTSGDADAALLESMRTIGQLQPILVVPAGPGYEVKAGHRRLAAARALGWPEIEAHVLREAPYGGAGPEVPETAMSAAENMVRAPMHPVDQWRAIVELRRSSGYSLETAAAALGTPLALARRMEWLGAMIPAMLEAIGSGDLPSVRVLRVIAQAPHDVQEAALKHHRAGDEVTWDHVANACTVKRIPRGRALFDTKLIAWDEDLFAEAGAPDQFTTTDVAAFLALQREAMGAKVARSKGRYAINDSGEDQYGRVKLPKGWKQEWGVIPKRFVKDDPSRVFLALVEDGYQIGTVAEILATPAVKAVGDGASAADSDPAAAPERPAISKKVQQTLAQMKAGAVRARLGAAMAGPAIQAEAMLGALLLCFTFDNVRAGGLHGSPHGTIAKALVARDGSLRRDVDAAGLCRLAASVIGRAVAFDAPDARDTSGPGAEWLASAIDAEMPRTDTPEVLAGIRGDALAGIAGDHGAGSHGTVGALRKRLAGALPDWRAAAFGAPGPLPLDGDEDGGAALDDEPWSPTDAEAAE